MAIGVFSIVCLFIGLGIAIHCSDNDHDDGHGGYG